MKSPQQQLQKALNNLKIILQIATRPDLTPEETKFLKTLVRSQELAVAAKERRLPKPSGISSIIG